MEPRRKGLDTSPTFNKLGIVLMDANRISRQEAADLLRVSGSSIANYIKAGLIPQPMQIGRRYWHLREDIERVAKEGTPKRQA